MKKKVFWAGVVLLLLATVWRLSWPRFLPVMHLHGDPPQRESFEEMVNRAELIVLADVKAVKQGSDYIAPIVGTDSFYRIPTQRVTLEVVKLYKGDVSQGQRATLYQGGVGITRLYQFPFPALQINENDPVYERGERYVLMLRLVPIEDYVKPYQPEPWQEGMFIVIYPEGRMLLNVDGAVTSVLDNFGTNGMMLEEIEEMIATATIAAKFSSESNFSSTHCMPESVFTAEDMRARVDCHPKDYKLEIDEDTVVLFAFPDSVIEWYGPIFIVHVPSVAEAVLSTDGSVLFISSQSPDGQIAIEGVLNNPELMSSILERAREIEVLEQAKEVEEGINPSASSPFQAVYLVQHPGQLSLDDLQAHPEVAVTGGIDEFKQHAQAKVALWIDKNAVSQVDDQWLHEMPQKYYPLVLVGESNALCAFREMLTGFGIEGPPADCKAEASGFSVWMLREETSSSVSAFMNGYNQQPTVQDILDITNGLLEGKTK
jgi:hypothetical protein